jgi:hemolysin III
VAPEFFGLECGVNDSVDLGRRVKRAPYVGVPPDRFDREERANALIHAIGLLLGLAGSIVLLMATIRRGGPWQILGCVLYVITMLATYAASTLSHVVRDPLRRERMRVADQAAIFLFIAGSYTPVALTWLRGGHWWILHGVIWGIALTGFLSKSLFRHRVAPANFSMILHLAVGWAPVFAARPLIAAAPGALLLWFLAGGICYTIGTIFFRYDDRVPYFHAAWHGWVIAGSACQYFGILFYCAAARGA